MDKKTQLRVVVVDDESLARLNLRTLIEKDPELNLIKECENGYEAVEAIKTLSPDLIFLDIKMPEMNGFQVLENSEVEKIPAIIFATAFDEYAVKAFEFHALDYLLKPVEERRFKTAVKQAKNVLKNSELSSLSQKLLALINSHGLEKIPEKSYLERIVVKSTGKIIFLPVSDIQWIEADDYYVKICTQDKNYLQRETMSDLEKTLDPNHFQRIHRSIIVNINLIKEVQPDFNNKSVVVLKNGKRLKMSRPLQDLISRMKNKI